VGRRGRPLVTDKRRRDLLKTYAPVARVERMRVLRDEMLHVLGESRTLILMPRSPEEYRANGWGSSRP